MRYTGQFKDDKPEGTFKHYDEDGRLTTIQDFDATGKVSRARHFHPNGTLMATGKYIERMSNHCAGCRYKPALRTGDKACPFTTLYWDFLARHEKQLAGNPRMALQVKNLTRIPAPELAQIRQQAAALRKP